MVFRNSVSEFDVTTLDGKSIPFIDSSWIKIVHISRCSDIRKNEG